MVWAGVNRCCNATNPEGLLVRVGALGLEMNLPAGTAARLRQVLAVVVGTLAAGLVSEPATGPTSGWATRRPWSCCTSVWLSGRSEDT